MKLHMRRTGDWAVPATEEDFKRFSKVPVGRPLRCELKEISERSLKHHRLYFGGLLELALDYWEPSGGLVTPVEERLVKGFAAYCERTGNAQGALQEPLKEYLAIIQSGRAKKIELPTKSKAALHRWVKEELGYYDVYDTPTGPRKELKSISFNDRDQESFDAFYKEAFALIWRFIMIRIFDAEQEAQEAVMAKLEQMG